jgi:hypothetical protein
MKGVRTEEVIANLRVPCPVCGKQPRIYRDYGYEESGFGAWCTIECKPLFRKPHLKVECGKAEWKRALMGAVEGWDARAENEV